MTESSARHRDALECSNTVLPSAVGTASDLNGGCSQRAWPPRLGWFYGWQRHPWRARPFAEAAVLRELRAAANARAGCRRRRWPWGTCRRRTLLRPRALEARHVHVELGNAGLLAKSDDRVLRDVETRADIPHWHAGRVETGNVSTLGPGQRGERDLTSHTRCCRAGPWRTVSGQIRRQARDQAHQRPSLFQVHISKSH